MKLISQNGEWITEDGAYRIALDNTFETECDLDHPHPMKMTVAQFEEQADWYQRELKSLGATLKNVKVGRSWNQYYVWQCPGGQTHHYSMWTVEEIPGNYLDDCFDKFEQARAALEDRIGKVTLSRPRKPKPTRETVEGPHGSRLWKACGHRAELDINEQCYTCHNDV